MTGIGPASAIDEAWNEADRYYSGHAFASELHAYSCVSSAAKLRKRKSLEIRGSGYVVESLQASLWCLLNSTSFEEAVLKAVNLGDDTDTTGAITGALAGLHYGLDSIPQAWRLRLARFNDLDVLFNAFVVRVGSLA